MSILPKLNEFVKMRRGHFQNVPRIAAAGIAGAHRVGSIRARHLFILCGRLRNSTMTSVSA
ncbi:MAG: hypothetical protein ABR906_06445 [Terracidiphilus sp.]